MTVELRDATKADVRRIRSLYKIAFPKAERRPWRLIAQKRRQGLSDVWAVTADGNFVGMAITLNCDDRVLLDYFATEPESRGVGFGAAALALLRERYADKLFLLEVETTKTPSPDHDLRVRRKNFYLRCGMVEMPEYSANLFGVEMEILTAGDRLSFDRYHEIYEKAFGDRLAKHVILVENKPKNADF